MAKVVNISGDETSQAFEVLVRLRTLEVGMTIRIDSHTLERAAERGADPEEIREVVETGVPIPARANRLAKAKVYPFGQERNGRYYEQKRVEVFYTTEGEDTVTVTVYVFYGKWD